VADEMVERGTSEE